MLIKKLSNTPFHTINSHKNHHTNPPNKHYENLLIKSIVINQINKHKVKIYIQCTYTQIIIKKNS